MNYLKYIKNPFICIGLLSVFYAFYIPLNILPGAPHDDTLFYQLGYNIAHFRWLGDFSPVSNIKGPVYPIFIAISIFFHIPLRILEATFAILTSYYFIKFLGKVGINRNLLIIAYVLLIFYPYQYGFIDFRILRDMIYPQICLMVFASLGRIYYSIKSNGEISKKHAIIFGLFLFLYQNTREESVWIVPSLFLTFITIFVFLRNKFHLLIKSILISVLIYFFLSCSLGVLNYAKHGSAIGNVFKNSDFQSGYGALYRIKRDRLLLESVNREDFDRLYAISPTLSKLKDYIGSDQYNGWIETACYAHESQGKNIQKDTSCPKNMPAAFLLFALMDGMYSIGLKSPQQMSDYMKDVGREINTACDTKLIECDPPSINNMPPQLTSFSFHFADLLQKVRQSIEITIFYDPPALKSIISSADNNGAEKIRRRLHAFFFPTNEIILNSEIFEEKKINKNAKNAGWVDGIIQKSNGFDLTGWAYDGENKFDEVVVVSNHKQICSTRPSLKRGDINPNNPESIGFQCNVNYKVTPEPVKLEVYGYLSVKNSYHKLEVIDFVQATLSNKYDDLCYKKYNMDVGVAVARGIITGHEHWRIFGAAEKRKCGPFEIKSNDYFQKKIDNTITENIAYELIAKAYHVFISNMWFLVPIAALIMVFKKEGIFLFIWLLLASLISARILLISALDVVGMAPVSGMYLASGIYLYFILFVTSLIFILNVFTKKIFNN